MAASRRADGTPSGPQLSIGALSRATGIAVETLRTWESRYGFPVPARKPSGHRVYPTSSVPRLRRIAEALARGHRAGQVVGATDDDLSRLLEATPLVDRPQAAAAPFTLRDDDVLPELLRHVAGFDADRLTRVLLGEWARLGPIEFLETRVGPLLRAVGDAWETGRLEVRHEHFVSERIGDLLRSLRLRFEERALGPLVVFASLPGEAHGLGLQMSALVLAQAGCRILYLGTEVPTPQTASLAKDLNARAVAVSISSATRTPQTTAHLKGLREELPRRLVLLVGGDGAPKPRPGLEVIRDLRKLDDWGRRVVARASGAQRSG
jgi:MerR family transcriptional regulator, light-induced transcriptional regulator